MGKITWKCWLFQSIDNQNVRLIIEQTMEIIYVDDILTHQSLDDWQEVFSKRVYKY